MKQIRIFLIRNLATALFMAAYYLQERMHSENMRDICIIHWEGILDNFDGSKDTNSKVFVVALKKIAGLISKEIIICPEQYTEYINMSLKNMRRDRTLKKEYLQTVRNVFKANNIDPQSIIEVYHGNNTFHLFIKHLSPLVKLIGFEHGVAEIRWYFLRYKPFYFIKNFIKIIVGNMFFIFCRYAERDNLYVSLFAGRIKTVNRNISIKQVEKKYISIVARRTAGDDFKDGILLDDCGNTAIIMLSSSYEFAKNKEEIIKFHKDFAVYFQGILKNLKLHINTVIFKARPYDEYLDEVKECFKDYFGGYKVFFFDEISKTNYPIEFYLDFLKPQAIFGDISSGQFYSKELMPQIQMYSFHEYIMQYQYKHFGKMSAYYDWLIDLFYKKYAYVFSDIAPKIIRFA